MLLFSACLLPLLSLSIAYFQQTLGSNPFSSFMQHTGLWSLNFLLMTLAITPLRRWLCKLSRHIHSIYGKRLADWNYLIRCRRMLGLWTFFYASLHFLAYLYFEMDFIWQEVLFDIKARPAIDIALINLLILLLLSVTSINHIRRKMGKYWRRLHRLIYLSFLLSLLHMLMVVKATQGYFYLYALIGSILLLERVLVHFGILHHQKGDTGMENDRS
ncbi:MAG: sulfoxide reductase heme-binding subunit YedZ [Pseudomonadales bacterium]|nr:sulfoxide reductase heme-binding subunit YedZ [Pseudomonadales bacterium]